MEAVTAQPKLLYESCIFTQVISTTQHVVNPEASRSSLSISTTRKFARRVIITTRSQNDIVNVISIAILLFVCINLHTIYVDVRRRDDVVRRRTTTYVVVTTSYVVTTMYDVVRVPTHLTSYDVVRSVNAPIVKLSELTLTLMMR